ncbi:hypothetical protein D3C86_2153570 [compost metagenome]
MFAGGAGQIAAGVERHGTGIYRSSRSILGINLPLVLVGFHKVGVDVVRVT